MLWGPGATDSGAYNLLWTAQFGEAFHRGDLYPRWTSDSFEGLGSPTFYFYPPLFYWLSGALHFAGLSAGGALKAASLLILFASGLAMYAWLSHRGTRPVLGAALYMLAPYHLTDFYTRGAVAEAAAFVWAPLIVLAIDRLPKRSGVALLATSYTGLILSHLPAAVLITLFLAAPFALWKAWADRRVIVPGVMAATLGVGVSAFYWLPALTLQEHISTALLWGAYYQPSNWFVWRNPSPLYFAFYPALAVALAVLALPARSVWSAITLVAALAILGLIPFIWHIPALAKVQFPWRLLLVVEFAAITAIMAKAPSSALLSVGRLILIPPLIVAAVTATASVRTQISATEMLRQRLNAVEYLPRGLPTPGITATYRVPDLSPYRDLPRGATVRVTQEGSVTLGRANFPIWRVVRDGQVTPHTGPLVTFQATPGHYKIERVKLWQESVGAAASSIALLALIAVMFWTRGLGLISNRRPTRA